MIFALLPAIAAKRDEFSNELLGRYHADDRLRVPATVFNAILGRPEHI
jgi:hypothetical protein